MHATAELSDKMACSCDLNAGDEDRRHDHVRYLEIWNKNAPRACLCVTPEATEQTRIHAQMNV
jgi:hypothetical protein